MIISSAPGRCGIVGNPTDMYGGSVISCSTAERAHCWLAEYTALVLVVGNSAQQIDSDDDLHLSGSEVDIAKAILLHFGLGPHNFRYRLTATTDVPERAGLAGSTAMVVAILGCVLRHLEIEMDRHLVAETARKIENGVMGITCGYQDQYMAVYGGLNYMDFRGKEQLLQNEDEPFTTVEPLDTVVTDVPILVAHTGITRNSGILHRSIRDRWLDGEPEVVKGYIRIAELARLAKKALLQQQWDALGALMTENHEIQRALGGSGPQNEHLIQAALDGGAIAAKLAGAGGGGTIVALTLDPGRTARALHDAGSERILWPRPMPGLTVESSTQPQIAPEITWRG